MLDESLPSGCTIKSKILALLTLPAFYLRSSTDDVKHNASVLLSSHGSDALPAYSLRHPDPALPASKNRYAAALYDSYNPDILFGEVLLIPEWSKPTLSKEEIRSNGGVPPPPQPILPNDFIIQLYNPDQQVHVKWNGGSWNTAPYWGFEMPQQSFRQPSASALDRVQSDPTASENTPKLAFKWKKDGKFSKDYVCTLTEKSTNPDGSKKKSKEPDITIALFKHFKEITIYEPNLSRVEVEDPKGLEVVLLLGAIVIREVYNTGMNEAFNISEAPSTIAVQAGRRPQVATNAPAKTSRTPTAGVPPTDPRSQWELDMETARLKKQVEHEERQRRRTEEAETKRVRRMVEEEERRKREKQKAVDRETERLKKVYGKEQRAGIQQPYFSTQPGNPGHAVTHHPNPIQRPHSAAAAPYIAHNLRPPPQPSGPYLQPPGIGMASTSSFFGNRPAQQPAAPKKTSFWHNLGRRDDHNNTNSRLTKQRSVVF